MLGGCADFRGGYVACNELQQARALNQQLAIDPLAAQTNYRGVRQLLNAHGLRGADWHVGHRSPNERGTPRTGAGAGPEDMGWNLMAQSASDNRRLGRWPVTLEEQAFYHRIPAGYQRQGVHQQCHSNFQTPFIDRSHHDTPAYWPADRFDLPRVAWGDTMPGDGPWPWANEPVAPPWTPHRIAGHHRHHHDHMHSYSDAEHWAAGHFDMPQGWAQLVGSVLEQLQGGYVQGG